MKDLIVNVIEQEMRVIQCNSSKLYNKSRHYLRLCFNFNKVWTGLSKTVIFLTDDGNYEYSLTDDSLIVPNALLTGEWFKFTLVGRDTGDDVLVTTNTLIINLRDSGYTTDISTLDDDGISDVYTVLLGRFDDYYDKDVVDSLLNEKLDVDSAFSGDYDDLTDKPSIPSKTSDLVNDCGFLIEHQDLSDYIQKSSTTGLVRNDGSVDTSTYLTEHQDLSDYVQKSSTSGLLKNDGSVDTSTYLTEHQSLSDYVQKSATTGLLKNDGTIDTNIYLTSHQDISGKVNISDIVDNLSTDNASKVLSAKQGKVLNDLIGSAITYINE